MRVNETIRNLILATVALLILLTGCAKQDLYEPPGTPFEIVGHLPLPSKNEGLAVLGNYVFVAGGEAGLHSIDWSDPTNPVLAATINTTKFAEDIQVVRIFDGGVMRDIAHVVEGTEGVTSYDVTDPGHPVDLQTGTTAVVGRTVFIDEDLDPSQPYDVFLAEDWKGVRIFRSITGDPGILAYNGVFVGTNGKAYGLVVRDGWGYCADNEVGMCVLDLRVLDLSAVSLTAWADTPGSARFVALQGDYAFVADGTEGLAVFRINEGETPVKVAQYDLSGFSESIALRDGIMALAGNTGGVHFMDVNDPEHPIYLGTTSTPNATDVVFTEDGYCLVMDEDAGFYVLGPGAPFSDIAAPAPVSDVVAETGGAARVDVTFTMTGDDRMRGLATSVAMRYAETPITDETTWDAASSVTAVPDPLEPGQVMEHTITGLVASTTYHVAVRIVDDAGQMSPLAANGVATTADGIVLRNGSLDIEAGTVTDTYTYSVEALWEGDFTATEIIIDDAETHTMTSTDNENFTFQTTLPAGEHTYAFHFTAVGSGPAESEFAVGPVVGVSAFIMGSPVGEPGRLDDEVLRPVAFSREIIASNHEVTQDEWDAVMDPADDLSQYPGGDRPMDSATWFQAVAYCNALSVDQSLTPAYAINGQFVTWNQDADGWRLPTEAEWEFLCRAGTSTAIYNGNLLNLNCLVDPNLDAIAWYCGNETGGPSVGSLKAANDLGLYDMSGNVREWCWDWYGDLDADAALDPMGSATGSERVCRGGSWYFIGQECRSAARNAYPPDSADSAVGFRVVRNAP